MWSAHEDRCWGEGGTLQAQLEAAHLPFVGSGAEAARIAIDKWLTKQTIQDDPRIMTPEGQCFDPRLVCPLAPPVVLKPRDGGSSVDVHCCRTDSELAEGCRVLARDYDEVLAERLIVGREVTVSLLHGHTLPLVEIVPRATFYDFEAKYRRTDTAYLVDPELPASVTRQCREAAEAVFDRLGCRHLARVDFIVPDVGPPMLLEVNTMPGFTASSLLPRAAASAGIPFDALCRMLVECARADGAILAAPTGGESEP